MTREIKFRAWDESQNIMLDLEQVVHNGEVVLAVKHELQPQYDHIKLMQYTGLKDKNGVEIYEGDLVQLGMDKGTVVYSGACYFVKGKTTLNRLDDIYDLVEVIGNIYENPELLEGEQ